MDSTSALLESWINSTLRFLSYLHLIFVFSICLQYFISTSYLSFLWHVQEVVLSPFYSRTLLKLSSSFPSVFWQMRDVSLSFVLLGSFL